MVAFGSFFLSRLPYLLAAVVAYFCGCFNGAIFASKVFFHDDVRTHGSGNAGLTNFYRTYGAKYALGVILFDMGKTVIACLLGGFLLKNAMQDWTLGVLIGGLGCELGHMFPVFFGFKGGKGILSGGAIALMMDWRIAVVVWGLFLVLVALTRMVSVGSLAAGVAFAIMTAVVYRSLPVTILGIVIGVLVVWGHRSNIGRILRGEENTLHLHHKNSDSEGSK